MAVIGFTRTLAAEVGQWGIRVNAICPGLTETERVADLAAALAPKGITPQQATEQMVKQVTLANPMGRLAYPADVAQMAAFLASSESDYLTALSIIVAGGAVMD